VTNGGAADGQAAGRKGTVSVCDRAIRLGRRTTSSTEKGDDLRYALLAYGNIDVRDRTSEAQQRRINSGIAEVLGRPNVSGWLRLQDVETATTMRTDSATGRTLLTDGPFVDSKDFLGGFIVVEAENLDGALAIAGELQELRTAGAIEIRPVREEPLVGA
jgi:hypothetical protein